MTPEQAKRTAVEAAARAIWTRYTNSQVPPEDLRGIPWEDLTRWAQERPKLQEIVDLCHQEATDAVATYERAIWQPIETCPDGPPVVGWTGIRTFRGVWLDGAHDFGGVRGALIDGASGRWIACTHWRPDIEGPEGP